MQNLKFNMQGKKQYEIHARVYKWSLEIIKICRKIGEDKTGSIIQSQLIRSSTSVVANLREADCALSKKDFLKSVGISLKESNESKLWLQYIIDLSLHSRALVEPLIRENEEIIKILASIILKTKKSMHS